MNIVYQKILIHGNFEILHTGHIRLFSYSKEIGRILVVGLCTSGLDDQEIQRRLNQLNSNIFVDQVVCYTDVEELIDEVLPDVLVKGREFVNVENIEESILKRYGGKVIFSSGESNISQPKILPDFLSTGNLVFNEINSYCTRNNISSSDLLEAIDEFGKVKVLIVGDVIVDEYIECSPIGLSQESATLVARPNWSRKYLGGAGIIAAHCAALGANTSLLTIVGDDEESVLVRNKCREFQVNLVPVLDKSHPTVLKQRFINGKQMLFRLNRFKHEGITREIRREIREGFEKIVENFDAVIFADFSYGVFDFDEAVALVSLAREKGAFVAADSQSSSQIGNLLRFKGANLICPTEREARMEVRNKEGLIVLSEKLLDQMDSQFIFLKLGADGMLINGRKLRTDHIPALNDNPIDVAGAGDSILATSTLAFSSGTNPYMAALLGNVAAALQVSRLGNTPIQSSALKEIIGQLN